jgi:5,5'-dehydrodivanillate O-demethylase
MSIISPPEPSAPPLSPFETGPGTPAGRWLRSFWQPVAMSEDLAAGTAKPVKIMSEEFTLYRGQSGQAVLTEALCPHRLTSLSIGSVHGDDLRCRFHGWKFGPDGQCLEAPLQPASLVERIRNKVYPLREEHGLVFVFIGEGDTPPFPDIAAYSRANGQDIFSAQVQWNDAYRRYCSYYVNTENVVDLAHVPYTHALSSNPEFTELGFAPELAVARDTTIERLEFGVRVTDVDETGLHADATVLLPNVMHLRVAWRDGMMEQFNWRVPIDDESHRAFSIYGLHTDEENGRQFLEKRAAGRKLAEKYPLTEDCAAMILRGEATLMDFVDHPVLTLIEDAITQQGMQFVADADKQNLSKSDKAVLQLRRMFLSKLADFVAGEPSSLKGW